LLFFYDFQLHHLVSRSRPAAVNSSAFDNPPSQLLRLSGVIARQRTVRLSLVMRGISLPGFGAVQHLCY